MISDVFWAVGCVCILISTGLALYRHYRVAYAVLAFATFLFALERVLS